MPQVLEHRIEDRRTVHDLRRRNDEHDLARPGIAQPTVASS